MQFSTDTWFSHAESLFVCHAVGMRGNTTWSQTAQYKWTLALTLTDKQTTQREGEREDDDDDTLLLKDKDLSQDGLFTNLSLMTNICNRQ